MDKDWWGISNWQTVFTSRVVSVEDLCPFGEYHIIECRQGGTSGHPRQYEAACKNCGKILYEIEI